MIVATTNTLSIFTHGGVLVEKILDLGILGLIDAIGLGKGNLVILKTEEGNKFPTFYFLEWVQYESYVDWVFLKCCLKN